MPLFEFLVELWLRFALTFQLDPFYFAAVGAIGFLPREQIEAIYQAYGNVLSGPICGLTAMADDGRFNRSVPWIWIAEPDSVCRVQDLAHALAHELRHVAEWLTNGVQVWPGHN